jgi:catechol 2,3-dioxygenase-like lactoylglutathione lyase family enzyme
VGSGDLCFHSSVPVDEVKARLEAAGIEIIVGPARRAGAIGPLMSVYCRDPDGNLIEIANRVSV